ncbi:MAG: SgcJ/EcaC family oxidoreductase [Woeseiaceae bacterium]
MKSWLLILLITANAAAWAADAPKVVGPQEDVDAIFEMFTGMSAARNTGDADQVAQFYHPDMLIMTRGRALLEGREGARVFYQENYAPDSSRELYSDVIELQVLGDIAIVAGRFLVVDEPADVEDPGYYLLVLKKTDEGRWTIYRDMDTPSPDGLVLKGDGAP